jgi:hypothetical protein
MMFKELKEIKKPLPSQRFCKEKGIKIPKPLLVQTVNYSRIFTFRAGSWNSTPLQSHG